MTLLVSLPSTALACAALLAGRGGAVPTVQDAPVQLSPRSAVFEVGVERLTSPEFDLYVLAQSWQPQFCAGKQAVYPGCSAPQPFWRSHFTLHGLWPELENGSPPSFCAGEPFDASKVEQAVGLDTLMEYWPDVKVQDGSPEYSDFWKHEWTRHGTCSGLSQPEFFLAAVGLERNDSLAPTPQLVQDNVGKQVSTAALRAAFAIKEGTSTDGSMGGAVLKCVHGDALSQVFTCWAKDERHAPIARRACPQHVIREDTCFKRSVRIAAFPSE